MIDGITYMHSFSGTELLGIVYHDDTVTHNDTHQTDDTQGAGHTKFHTLNQHTGCRTKQTEHHAAKDQERDTDLLEMGQQNKEDHKGSNGQSRHDQRHILLILFQITAVVQFHTLRQMQFIDLTHHLFGELGHINSALHIRHHGDGINTVTTHNLSVLHSGSQCGNLA